MTVPLTPDPQDLVQRLVASGEYASAGEVAREGLRLLEERRRLAGSSQAAFMRVLNEREVPLHYGVEELEQELRTLDASGS